MDEEMHAPAELSGSSVLEHQVQLLQEQVSENRGDIDALQVDAQRASERADVSEDHIVEMEARLEMVEDAVDLDRAMIVELQAKGLVSAEHAGQLQEALLSARTIGAAIGVIVASRKVPEDEAFALLVRASQNTNNKLRLLARDIVDTGDLSSLPPA